jgi:hypothetical protein
MANSPPPPPPPPSVVVADFVKQQQQLYAIDEKQQPQQHFFDDLIVERRAEKIILFVMFNIVWTLVLLGIMIGKLVETGGHEYIIHYTNWCWTANVIFYLLETIGQLYSASLVHHGTRNAFMVGVVGGVFWIANGMSWLVFWLVFVMLADNSNILLDMTTGYGGQYTLGFVLDMDRLFHVLPALFNLLYCFLRKKQLAFAIEVLAYRGSFNHLDTWVYLLYILFGPLLSLVFYIVSYNISQIYGITTPLAILIFLAIAVVLIFNGATFLVVRRSFV